MRDVVWLSRFGCLGVTRLNGLGNGMDYTVAVFSVAEWGSGNRLNTSCTYRHRCSKEEARPWNLQRARALGSDGYEGMR